LVAVRPVPSNVPFQRNPENHPQLPQANTSRRQVYPPVRRVFGIHIARCTEILFADNVLQIAASDNVEFARRIDAIHKLAVQPIR